LSTVTIRLSTGTFVGEAPSRELAFARAVQQAAPALRAILASAPAPTPKDSARTPKPAYGALRGSQTRPRRGA